MVDIIKLTLIVNLSASILGMLFGLVLGYRLYFFQGKIKAIILYLVKTLMGLPPVILGLLLFLLFKNNGSLGFLHLLYEPMILIIAQTLLIIPIVAGNVYQVLNTKGQLLFFTLEMYELSFWQKIKYSIKEFKNELLFIYILGFSRAVSEVGAIMIVGGNIKNHTRMMTTALANLKSQGNYNEALVYGFILLIIAFIVQLLLSILEQKGDNYENF